MKLNDLCIGERLSIRSIFSDGSYSSATYTSKIEDFPFPDHMYISSPTASNMSAWIGKNFQLIVSRKDAPYTFKVQAIEQKIENNVFSVLVKVISDFTKIQRRNYYRFKIKLNANIYEIGSVDTVDISGSGLSLKMSKPLHKNAKIIGTLCLGHEQIEFTADVVASELVVASAIPNYYVVRVHFPDIDRREQDKIVKFINHASKQRRNFIK